jgi:hypothetical protein
VASAHQLRWDNNGRAFFQLIPCGEHTGVIYMFRFGMPSVRRTEYVIRDFNCFFRIYRPERVIRQHCGLPYFSPYERNIALTEVSRTTGPSSDRSDRCWGSNPSNQPP